MKIIKRFKNYRLERKSSMALFVLFTHSLLKRKNLKVIAAALVVTILSSTKPAAAAEDDLIPFGYWSGTLQSDFQQLPLVFKIQQVGENVRVRLDSPNQNANNIPATFKVDDSGQFTIDVDLINARFSGTLNEQRNLLSGIFTQNGVDLPLTLALDADKAARGLDEGTTLAPKIAAKITGTWRGESKDGLSLNFSVSQTSTDSVEGSFDIPKRNVFGIPFTVKSEGETVVFDIPLIHGNFSGNFAEDGHLLRGTWSQSDRSRPMTLTRVNSTQ